MTAPLDGIKVVEVAGWMAAPGAAMMMADLGAEVVKIEPLGGDALRGSTRQPTRDDVPPIDPGFLHDNRGKKGVAIAMNTPQGIELAQQLAGQADVFICNLLPRRQAKFGLDSASLFARNPRLVHATLTGYGTTGPDAERPGYDITAYFGRGGMAHTMTEPGAFAPRVRPAMGDHTASLAMLASVLAALRVVDATGEGQVVETSLLGAASWSMSTDLAASLLDGEEPLSGGRLGRLFALHGAFRTGDDRFVLLFMPEPRYWTAFCEAVGHPEWLEDERYATHAARREHMTEVTADLDALFASRSLAEWTELLDANGFIWAPAATIAELARDPQAKQIGLFQSVDSEHGPIKVVASPVTVRGADVRPRGMAPAIGEHTLEVLGALGMSEEQITSLAADGVIGVPAAS